MKVNLYTLSGRTKGKVDLPSAFETPVRTDIIRRAVNAARANRRQPYGPNARAGMRHAASTWGKGRGVARVQRMKQGSTAVESPNNVGGRRCHPPRPDRDWSEKINRKERQAAFYSALAATTSSALVTNRGHCYHGKLTLPLVLEPALEESWNEKFEKRLEADLPPEYARQGSLLLRKLKVEEDLVRAKQGHHIRAGQGKLRGRKYRTPRSLLVVLSRFNGVERAFANLPGVEVTTAAHLNTELLAPGGDPGRLTLFTSQALEALNQRLEPAATPGGEAP